MNEFRPAAVVLVASLALPASASPGRPDLGPALGAARALGFEADPSDLVEPETPFSTLAAPPAEARLFGPELWAGLPAPHPEVLKWLVARSPGLNPAMVRQLDEASATAIFERAVELGLTPMDLFTDAGLRGPEILYFPQALIAKLYASYEIRVITQAGGTATDGRSFAMLAMLAGGRRTELLYDRSFTANNDFFPEFSYNIDSRVVQAINGPGDVSFTGLSANAALRTTIRRMVKIGPREVRIETNWGDRKRGMLPLRRR